MNVANQVSLVKVPQFEGSSLKVGDFVFVRLLKQLENNKVIVSFGGQAFEATVYKSIWIFRNNLIFVI